MPVRHTASRSQHFFHATLLASVSALTLFAGASSAQARNILTMGSGSPGGAAANQAALAAVQQAADATAQARNSLSRATQAIQTQAMQAAQSAARNLTLQASGTIPDGLGANGLQVAPNVGTDPTLWQNANLPTQSQANGQTLITIQQTAQKSILTWQSFNVSKNTTVYFDQSAGNQTNGSNDWISLNRIQDPSGVPSKIFGQIEAEGSVYLINRNGIIFGHSSQVDVHTLIASSLGFLGESVTANMVPGTTAYDNAVSASNAQFLNTTAGGIAAPEATGGVSDGGGNLVLGVGTQLTGAAAASFVPSGDIDIKAGASITSHANGNASDGGFVLIAAPTVDNAGTITTPDGQAILAAGIGVGLIRSSVPTQFLLPELTGRISVNGKDATPVGALTNTGFVDASTGNVTLLGTNISLGGVVEVTTSVSVPGSITISTVDEADTRDGIFDSPTGAAASDRRAGQLIVSGILANLPEENGQTVPSDGGSFTPGSLSLTGGSIWLQNGSLIEAPGAQVGVTALVPTVVLDSAPPGDTAVQGRVYIDNGATIDVAGLSDVELPISDILVTIPLIGQNELANSPLQRNSFLMGLKNVVLDSTLSGTTADGLAWVGSPLLNASGYADLIPRSIDQLLTNGGSITLSGGQVMTATGSSLNLDGGYVHYLGGVINTTRLMDASGHIVDIGNADPNDSYVGIAGQFTVDHSHWGAGVSTTYGSPLLTGGTYEPDYIVGGNAGSLNVFGQTATVLDGAMSAQAVPGMKQIEAGLAPSGTNPGGNFLPEGGSFILGEVSAPAYGSHDSLTGALGSVIIQNQAPDLGDLSPGFGANTPLDTAALNALGADDPDNVLAWTTVPAATIGKGGFANVTVTMNGTGGGAGPIVVAQGTTLAVQPGGSITLTGRGGNLVSVLGDLTAISGTISVSGGADIIVGPDAVISAAGTWVNDQGQPNAIGAATYVDGGSISLSTTGLNSILLNPGSVLDVSSGGVMQEDGQLQMSNGVPVGKGGNVSLIADAGVFNGQFGFSPTQPVDGRIAMDGTIESWGFAGGGTLTLQTLGFQIGGDPSRAPSWDLYLPADFFEGQGFGKYQLNAMYDADVAPGTDVRLTQRNLIPNLDALAEAPSGADLHAGNRTALGTLDPYYRQATSLVLTAGGDMNNATSPSEVVLYPGVTNAVTIGAGAVIDADAGASIGLGSPAQVTVLGSIIAPGGSITLSADDGDGYGFEQPGQVSASYASPSKSVWLGADAVLDVAGVALINPSPSPVREGSGFQVPVTGKVLAGGSVALSDDSGYVVAEAGSMIDVSGASATLDEPQVSSAGTVAYAPQLVWSDAGSITLGAEGLYFDGTIKAHAGAPQGQGGNLTILAELPSAVAPAGAALILQQSGNLVPAGLAPGQNFSSPAIGVLQFAVDRLAGSGVDTLIIGPATDASGSQLPLVPLAFAGNVSLSLGNAVIINAPEIVALPAGATALPALVAGTSRIGAPSVSITAPYVEIDGGTASNGTTLQTGAIASLADGTLNVNAAFIDIENQIALANFGQANFTSSGDIRLSTTNTASSVNLQLGELYTPGNLTFQAADLYPASGETFILDATGPKPTTITFLANGASQVPLSAGGTLLVDATDIVQSGTIRAPSGSIVLGVGDATDAATLKQFGGLPLTNTQSVSLTSGSTTSVSLDGAIIPYGTTIDGQEWQYNTVPANTAAQDLTAPPAKVITVNGANVSLGSGATIDLSGGGDLQAIEWVPGTGGSRNVLSQYNLTYPASGAAVATPLYPDARNVYAIVPSYEAPVAAYDPVYAQSTQPAKAPNGTPTTQTEVSGVGQAALGGQIGQSVYLSGVPGLPAGTYTLLPAQYATLPGAYRVVQNTGAANVMPGQSTTLPDGTHVVSGYYVDGLNGARGSIPVQFQVQSAAVWGQYSQYTLTSANSFFPMQAANAGTIVPALPMDAGRLVLAATSSLILDTTLKAAAAPGGAAAEVDIASQDIQIVGNGEPALAGYLQISADGLTELGAGSLLIGGTRLATTSGVTIDALANSVVVSNDAADPLTGPEIILVAKTDPSGTDPNAANGLRIDGGSVIAAQGAFSAASDVPITIGQSADSTTGVTAVSGDGALLMVTNGGLAPIARNDMPATPQGRLTVGAGADIDGGQALLLDSSGTLTFDPAAGFAGHAIAIDAGAITLTNETGAAAAALPGFVIGENGLAQFASATQVDLRSYTNIDFVGDLNLSFGNAVELSAGSFDSDGGTVTLNAQKVSFTNDLGAPVPASAAGTGALAVDATEIDLGSGDKVLSGFGAVTMTATGGIVGQNTGTLDLGAANATLTAPVYLADTSSDATLKTTGTLTLNASTGTALALTPVGGALSFIGGTLNDNGATVMAPAGNVGLEATSGDLTIASGSLVSSAGVSKQFFDITAYAPAGNLTLTADAGTVNVASGATLDFSGAEGGGAAGSLTLSAPVQTVQLNGTIKGGAAAGYLGGSFSLDTGGAVDLDSLATELASSGVDDAITVQTGAGNLVLSAGNTLTAHVVSLTADGGAGGQDPANGNVTILGTINAAGNAGGEIDLYGKSGVDLEGSLIATGATQRGGTVNIGTTATFDPAAIDPATGLANPYNATYGYENVFTSGVIRLGANADIDVSGGTAGGTVSFRAPLLADGDVNVFLPAAFNPGKGIVGARATTLEAFAVWSTTDATTGAQHFDGIVDPAGWYDASGTLLAGSFADASGNTVASWDGTTLINSDGTTNNLAYYLTNDYFAPTAANTDVSRAAHETFYGYQNGDTTAAAPGTLMGFVENFPISAATASRLAGLTVTPGIELDNPTPATGPTSINGGNISILTNWNLGSGSSATDLDFRFHGQAPVITFKAENDIKVDASLTDGFFQVANPLGNTINVPQSGNYTNYSADEAAFTEKLPGSNYGLYYYAYRGIGAPAEQSVFSGGDPGEIAQYYAIYSAYVNYLMGKNSITGTTNFNFAYFENFGIPIPGQPIFTVPVPTLAQQMADPTAYLAYLGAYEVYVNSIIQFSLKATNGATGQTGQIVNLQAPLAVLAPVTTKTSIPIGGAIVLDNSPSPVAVANNPLPLPSASLSGGTSSSFKLIAGADLSSANPLASQAAALFGNGGGSVTLDGHFSYIDTNGQTINVPTMIRTGTGSIDITAAGNVNLSDTTAPGVIYTAGAPVAEAPVGTGSSILAGDPLNGAYDLLVTNAVNPDGGGDISIQAGKDITGVETVNGTGNANSQFWWQWMQTGNTYVGGQITQTSINFGAFDQGIMSVGGNVSVSAGGDITNLAVSLPTTWYLTNNNTVVNTVGGGNLTVTAGGNILNGDYFVAKGTGTLTAGGRIGSSGLSFGPIGDSVQVSTLLAAQDGAFNISARQGVDIGAMVDPSYIQGNALTVGYRGLHADAQSYSAGSALNVVSTTGDVALNTLSALSLLGALTNSLGDSSAVLPATVDLTAVTGGITVARAGELYPSATGQLSLIADQSINLYDVGSSNILDFGLIDASASALPSPLNPMSGTVATNEFDGNLASAAPIDHSQTPLHANDTQPVRIYSLTGSIIDGLALPPNQQNVVFYDDLVQLAVDKPALIQAGKDILNLAFLGQNLRDDDVTRVIAGNDIRDSRNFTAVGNFIAPSLLIGGPGTFDIEAGRNIGPLTNQAEIFALERRAGAATGIDAVGNANDPYLPHESANVQVLFGVGKGIDDAAFIANYIAPGASIPGIDTMPALIAFMEQYDEGQGIDTGLVKDKPVVTLTSGQAWTQFQALPVYVQQLFSEQVLFQVLQTVDEDFKNPASAFFNQYARGYQAINTLFPAALGYTANSLDGGTNGANKLVDTGDLDMRSTTIQTQQGGNVTILGPGGQALVGSASAPPVITDSNGDVVVGPGDEGILTLEQGNVDILTDRSLLLAQSRIFTEQGGDMVIWSSNGDINAGKGAKTVADVPPPQYIGDDDHYNTLDARGEVTGAGIATLQTIPGAEPGNVFLIAPRGTVDAGDAGIRVSGNLFVAALTVANADNIQVQGTSVGVPHQAAVDTGALTSASNAAGAATAAAEATRQTGRPGPQDLPSIITVEVIGYGGDGTPAQPQHEENRRKARDQQSYDPASSVQYVGVGALTDEQMHKLTPEEQRKVSVQ